MSVSVQKSEVVIKGLQNLLESELSKLILKPLFKKIYRAEVAPAAKSNDSDNDLIIHKWDELGDPSIICVQVRRISTQLGAQYGLNEQKLVSHLSGIKRQGVHCDVTGGKLKVDKVILVTPFVMDAGKTGEHFKALSIAIRAHDIRLIDGHELAGLITKHLPELLHLFVDKCYLINQSIKHTLDNETLYSALNLTPAEQLEHRYSPVSVTPGGKYLVEQLPSQKTCADYVKTPSVYNTPVNFLDENVRCDIEEIFDSGENIAVLGEAGSGKTTNLKHYAAKLLDGNSDKLVIFTTLNKVASCAEVLNSRSILDGLVGYLSELKSSVSVGALTEHLTHHRSVVILDSIDEAIVEHEWVISAMVAFSESFPKCQMITSSRYSVEGLTDMPFFHLSILPFDEEQKRLFFQKWFAKMPEKAQTVLEHLQNNPTLSQIVANPLSATILCVLCQNDVPLPRSEAALYKKRMEMLAGVYDHYRGIKRTALEPGFLLDVARVIAFGMHIRKRSSFDKQFAVSVCLNFFTEPHQVPLIQQAIEELISPTEIIVPSVHGGYDFGHLRIQEFLASEELINRRNVNYKELINDRWWGETFVLMSQHAREIESVVNEVCAAGYVGKVKPLLMKMIAARSTREKEIFTKRVNQSHRYESGGYY